MAAELEAAYTLLTQAAATDHALRSRLRTSQALVWGDQALMLTRMAPSGTSHKPVSAPVDLRFKRRMEWEVSRRIARVDRELRDLPPNQRFWHRKKKVELEQTARAKIQVEAAASKERRAKMAKEGPTAQPKKVIRAKKTTPPLRIQTNISIESSPAQSPLASKRSRKQTDELISAIHKPTIAGMDTPQESKTTGAKMLIPSDSPVLSPMKISKENQQPNEIKTVAVAVEDESSAKDVVSDKNSETLTDSKRESTMPETENASEQAALELKLEQDTSPLEIQLQQFSQKREGNIAISPPSSSKESSPSGHTTTSQRRQQPWQNPSVSSLGRQVLSEFRSSGGPSFGLPPISVSARGQPRQLNRDVLRRLFSDLDSDKDGRLNRIETCLALHRLQIVVPAAKIATFFRHIYDSSQSHDDFVEPWKEVISYAQFVAFVTAVHEKQQQFRRPKLNTRQRAARIARSPPQPEVSPRGHRVRQYVVESDLDEEHTANAVFEKIPDYLVGRLLSEPTKSSVKATTAVVRRSLENVLPGKKIQDEDIIAIAQDLVKVHIKSNQIAQSEIEDDTTGLLRAAAYFENDQLASGLDGIFTYDDTVDSDVYNQTEWLNKLTEEQVTCMVHQLWKERQQMRYDEQTQILAESAPEETQSQQLQEFKSEDEVNDEHTLEEKATDMSDFPAHVNMVSEKAVQVENKVDDNETKNFESVIGALPMSEKAQAETSRSNLANAVLKFSEQNGISPDMGEDKNPLRAVSERRIAILQAMRHRRKQYQGNSPASTTIAREVSNPFTPPVKTNDVVPTTEVALKNFNQEEVTRLSVSTDASNDDEDKISETEDKDVDIRSGTDTIPTVNRKLAAPVFVNAYQATDSVRSSMSNRSDLSGASNPRESTEFNPRLFSPLDFKPRAEAVRSRRSGASSYSSDHDSIVSEDLSEGEIQGSDLSDGEIYGHERKRLVQFKNRSSHILNETASNSESDIHSSVESGELLPIRKVHRNFRQQLMSSSSSSIESGEFELGLLS